MIKNINFVLMCVCRHSRSSRKSNVQQAFRDSEGLTQEVLAAAEMLGMYRSQDSRVSAFGGLGDDFSVSVDRMPDGTEVEVPDFKNPVFEGDSDADDSLDHLYNNLNFDSGSTN